MSKLQKNHSLKKMVTHAKKLVPKNGTGGESMKNKNILVALLLTIVTVPFGSAILETITYEPTGDVWIENSHNKNSYNFLIVGKAGSYEKKRSLIEFDTAAIDAISQTGLITDAELSLYHYGYGCVGGETKIARNIEIYQMWREWKENQATKYKNLATSNWNQPLVGLDEVDADPDFVNTQVWGVNDYGWKNYDVTNLVKYWLVNRELSHGILLKADNENTAGCDIRIRSSEYSNSAYRPKLKVTFDRVYFWNQTYLGIDNVDAAITPTSQNNVYRDGWYEFDMTNLVQAWADETYENHGVLLWATNENTDGCDLRFRSREYGNNSAPYLKVKYRVAGIPGPAFATVYLPATDDLWLEREKDGEPYDFFIVGKARNYPKKRSLIKFDLSSLPEGTIVLDAKMHLYKFGHGCSGDQLIQRTIQTHRVLEYWNEESTTCFVRLR